MRKLMLLFGAGFLLAAFALPAFGATTPTTTTATTTTPTATAAAPASTTSDAAPSRPARPHLHWFAGSVTAVGADSLTIGVLWTGPNDGSLNGQTVTVSVPSNARINQGPHRAPIALAAIQPNDLVSMRVVGEDPSSLSAARIHVYCNCHWLGGTISAIGASTVTVHVARTGPYDTVLNGQNVTVQVSATTVYLRGPHRARLALSDLQAGSGVGVVFSATGFFKAPGFDPATATFTAKRVHVWPNRQVPPASTDASASAQTTAS